MAEKRSRKFALVTYIQDTGEVLSLIMKKQTSIRAFALIKHDKDEADPHHHIVIRTHCAWTCPQVAKWFKDNIEKQNTFVQFVIDDTGIIEYLTHENEQDGYHYDKEDIIDGGLADLMPSESEQDNSLDIIDDIIAKVPIRDLIRRYGRNFVFHFSQYVAVAETVAKQDEDAAAGKPPSSYLTSIYAPAPPNYTK